MRSTNDLYRLCQKLVDKGQGSRLINNVDGFIFVGTIFHGLSKHYTFVGFKIRGHSFFFSLFIQKIAFSWVLDFVDRTLHKNHENWYPTKIKPSTVSD